MRLGDVQETPFWLSEPVRVGDDGVTFGRGVHNGDELLDVFPDQLVVQDLVLQPHRGAEVVFGEQRLEEVQLLVRSVDLLVQGVHDWREETFQAEGNSLLLGEGGALVEEGRVQEVGAGEIAFDRSCYRQSRGVGDLHPGLFANGGLFHDLAIVSGHVCVWVLVLFCREGVPGGGITRVLVREEAARRINSGRKFSRTNKYRGAEHKTTGATPTRVASPDSRAQQGATIPCAEPAGGPTYYIRRSRTRRLSALSPLSGRPDRPQ